MAFPTITGHSFDVSNNQGSHFGLRETFAAHKYLSNVACKRAEGSTFADPDFERFFSEAASIGKTVMPYEFARPDLEPGAAGGQKAAEFTLAELKGLLGKPTMGRIVLDYESVKDPAYARAFIEYVGHALGARAQGVILYCSASRLADFRGDPYWYGVDFWVADYGASPAQLASYVPARFHIVMWQYTDHWAPYPGAKVDASFLYGNVKSDYQLYRPDSVLQVTAGGKVVKSVKYGGGRVRAYLCSNPFLKLLYGAKNVVLRRR